MINLQRSYFPLHIETVKRAVKYWLRILKMGPERYVKKCYAMLVNDDKHGQKIGCLN